MSQNSPVTAKYDGVKVFSETKFKDRELLGEKVTEWLKNNPKFRPVATVVTQSSDTEFHCLTITVFYVVG